MGVRAFTDNNGGWEWAQPTPQNYNLVRGDPGLNPLECSLPNTEFTLWGAYDQGMVAAQFIPGPGSIDEMRLYRIPFGATAGGLIGIIGGIPHGSLIFLDPSHLAVDSSGMNAGVVIGTSFAGIIDGTPVKLVSPQLVVSPILNVYGASLAETDTYGLVLMIWGSDGDGGLQVLAKDALAGTHLYSDNLPWLPLGTYDEITPPGVDVGGVSFLIRDDNGETPNDIIAHTMYATGALDYVEDIISPVATGPYAGTTRWPISIGTHTAVVMYAVPTGGGKYNYFVTEVDRETGEFRPPVRASVAGFFMDETFVSGGSGVSGSFGPSDNGPFVIGPGPLRITGPRDGQAMVSFNGGLSFIGLDNIGAEQFVLPRFIWQGEIPNASEFWTEFDESYEVPGPMTSQPQPWAPNRNNYVPPTIPVNDTFAAATAIPVVESISSGGNFLDLQTLLNASLEASEPAAGSSDGTVWYSWVCPAGATGTLDVWAETNDTFNSTCDIFTGASLAALVSAATGTYTWEEGTVATSTVTMFEPVDDQLFYIRVRRTDAGAGGPFAVYIDYD